MRIPDIQHVKQVFDRQLADSLALTHRVQHYRVQLATRVRPLRPAAEDLVVEMAFMRMFLAWEDFLEESFVHYMTGAVPAHGRKPVPIVVYGEIEHARKVVYGNGRKYTDWCEPSRVIDRAKLHFKKGEPFASAVAGASVHLMRMRTIRNRIAHRSTWAHEQFKGLLSEFYGSAATITTPGRALLAPPPPAAMPAAGGLAALTLGDLYGSILAAVAAQIVRTR